MTEPVDVPGEADLDLQEAISSPATTVNADGTVMMHLIRPCIGRGKGRHLYEADMLQKNAGIFGGWRMYIDHETEQQRRARGGLPRSVKDLGGVVLESKWDPSVPANGRFGAGAVVAKVRPIKEISSLIDLHPSLVESSINARATGVRPVTRDGGRAWLVEGLESKGSVDWVTDGGAGGKVVELLEAVHSSSPADQEAALYDSMTDDELRDHIALTRPAVLQEAAASAPGDGDGDEGDMEDEIKALMAKGLSRPLAIKACQRKAAAAKKTQEAEVTPPAATDPNNEGGVVAQVTAEDIREAVLQSPEVADLIGDLVEARLTERLGEERTQIRAEAFTDAQREIELRDLRDRAQTRIREAALPAAFEARALAEFAITSQGPTEALDCFEAYDAEGNVSATAEDVLDQVVEAVIDEQRGLVASLRPTRVRGMGPQGAAGDGGEGGEGAKPDRLGDLTRSHLQEAGIDPEKFQESLALRG